MSRSGPSCPPPESDSRGMPPAVREKLLALRERLVERAAAAESHDVAAKRATAEAQDRTAQRVAEYERGDR